MELPVEFENNMRELLGSDYDEYVLSLSQKRLYGLRVNTLKISVEDFLKITPFELKKIPYIENGFFYDGEKEQPAKHPYYFAGLYYLQDPSAMTPASRLPMEKGLRVLDLCAAPGGKSTELAARLCGSGVLMANDISVKRARALKKNIELFGIKNSIITTEYPEKISEYFYEYFDRILVDAPCSGEGMFRKDPSMVYAWKESLPKEYSRLQADIVEHAVKMLKPGGYMLYSTCTFSPLEDEMTVSKILDKGQMSLEDMEWYEGFSEGMPEAIESEDISLKKCARIFPHRMDGEGHFLALMKKKTSEKEGVLNTYENKEKTESDINNDLIYKGLSKEEKSLWEEFAGAINKDFFCGGHIESHASNLYYISDQTPDLNHIKYINAGLYLGECKKNRFDPSQALAMALKAKEYSNILDIPSTDDTVTGYLKGQTINTTDDIKDGWVLVCVDGFPLGWGKKKGNIIKNKYLSGWRMM